jgi:hypothetical protein
MRFCAREGRFFYYSLNAATPNGKSARLAFYISVFVVLQMRGMLFNIAFAVYFHENAPSNGISEFAFDRKCFFWEN